MNRERLEQMVVMLRAISKESFDIETWSCGTASCAVGHACVSPVFQAQGLNLFDCGGSGEFGPKYGEKLGWRAAQSFFEIDSVTADHLFLGDAYQSTSHGAEEIEVTPNMVADRIAELLSEA